jgi:hypothetical protein
MQTSILLAVALGLLASAGSTRTTTVPQATAAAAGDNTVMSGNPIIVDAPYFEWGWRNSAGCGSSISVAMVGGVVAAVGVIVALL